VGIRKTRTMIATERRFGKTIEQLLDELYYDRDQPYSKVADQLGVSEATLYLWKRKLGLNEPEPDGVAVAS
jgi:transposase-like protein